MLLPPAEEVQVWVWHSVPDVIAQGQYHEVLSDAERLRAARFAFERDRIRYVSAHAGLRLVLGGLLGTAAAEISLVEDRNGKPRLAGDGRPPLFFNLSHSHDLAAIAVSASFEIGFDIELLRDADLSGLITMFSKTEQEALEALPQQARTASALKVWTRKEAFMKATGLGLTMPLDSFDVSVDPGNLARLLRVADAPDEAGYWQMTDLTPKVGYIGTVAVRSLGWHVTLHEITLTD